VNPKKPIEFKKLVDSVKESFRKMSTFRDKRTDLIKAFVGSDYSDEGEAKKVYLYLLTMAVNIYVRNLVVRAPLAHITTPHRSLRPMAANFQLACKDVAQETELGETLKLCAMDALFSPRAVTKVGLEYLGKSEVDGTEVDLTAPFVRKVSFDDYVIDMSARSAGHPAFEGDRYYVSKEEFERRFKGEWKKLGLSESDLGMQNDQGEDRAEALSHSPGLGEENIKNQIELWDIFLPDTWDVVTYCAAKPERPLSIIKLDGPDEGLYQSVWFNPVPDNALGMPPLGTLRNIHELANSLFRRMVAQAQNQKRLVGFDNEQSANRFKTAKDSDGVFWQGQKPEMLEVGGIDQVNLATFIQVKDLFSWTAGNLDSLGGLSPMSETATQDEMLAQSSGAMIDDMRDAMTNFATAVFRQIAWYEWTDPVRTRTLQKEIPSTGDYIAVQWTSETRQADFLDFNFAINPYSMREESPDQKIRKLHNILTGFYGPLQPFFQMQGLTIDVRRLNELVADYSNLPELSQLIVDMDRQMVDAMGATGPQGIKAPQTKRTYERINRPGATRVGKDQALMQTLLGGKVQPTEAAAISRPVS
jgi:hypothetical protein